MPEARESSLREAPVLVGLLGNRLGHEIKKPGASFRLSNIYDHEPMAGNDVFTRVYFRTDSGNIYSLDTNGNLVNAKESQKRGSLVQTSLKPEELKEQKLTVGEPFSYGSPDNSGKTSVVTEIVPVVEHRTYIPDALQQITNGRTNTIREEFQKMLPPLKIGERNNRDLEGLVGPEDLEQLIRTRAGIPPKAEKKPQVSPLPTVNLAKEPMRAKGNEVPRVKTGPTKPEAQNIEGNDLERKAAELARATREHGIGVMIGKFPPRLAPGREWIFTDEACFIQGEEIPQDDDNIRTGYVLEMAMTPGSGALSIMYNITKSKDTGNGQQPYRGSPLWVSSNYNPSLEKEINNTKFLRESTGKTGESDWVRYEYLMGIDYPYDSRRYERDPACVMMAIAVPPNLAEQIDEQVGKNVYFPDAFFQAVYPGWVGPDRNTDLKRIPSTKLAIIDERTKSSKVVQYPQPIPY